MKKNLLIISTVLLMFPFSYSTLMNNDVYSFNSIPKKNTLIIESNEIVTEIQAIKIPVLMYHHISPSPSNDVTVSPSKFKEDMQTLKAEGYESIFFNDLYQYLDGRYNLPPKPIIITFDDGYYSNYEYAFPIAKEENTKIVISIIGWSMGRDAFIKSDQPILPHFSWTDANEMIKSNYIEIQNHTFDLHSQKGLSYGYDTDVNLGMLPLEHENNNSYVNRITVDLLKMNNLSKENLGAIPNFVIYPYGAYNETLENITEDLGFIGSVTINKGIRTYKSLKDLREIPRLNITESLKGPDLIKAIDSLPDL